jgi:hypothetical protein
MDSMSEIKNRNAALKELGKHPERYHFQSRKKVVKRYAWGKPVWLLSLRRNILAGILRIVRNSRK